jgi:hypothetical protein
VREKSLFLVDQLDLVLLGLAGGGAIVVEANNVPYYISSTAKTEAI